MRRRQSAFALTVLLAVVVAAPVHGADISFSGQGLLYSAHAGGDGVAVDADGNVYVLEPGRCPLDPAFPAIYVIKADKDARTVLYRRLVSCGATADRGIVVDARGNAYIAAMARADLFAATADFSRGGVTNPVVVVKLDPAGNTLYSVKVGGTENEGAAIAIDSAGSAYVTGYTMSADFPVTTGAFDTTFHGGPWLGDAFVFKLNPAGTRLEYSTFLGGSAHDRGAAIAVDSDGAAYITGTTESPDFPTTPGTLNQLESVQFITKLNPAGSALVYSTRFGGAAYPSAIAVDAAGEVYVAGSTFDDHIPTTPGAAQVTRVGADDAYVVRLDAAGGSVIYGTYIGGTSYDYATTLAIGRDGSAFLAGTTEAAGGFPVTTRALQTAPQGGTDAFVTVLDGSGRIRYSTRLGGGSVESEPHIVVDAIGDVYFTAESFSADYPVTPGAIETTPVGTRDRVAGVLSKLVPSASFAISALASSVESDALGPMNAVDGDPATRWSSQFSDPQGLTIDLGQRVLVSRVVLNWETAYGDAYDVFIADADVLTDNVPWTLLYTTANGDGAIDDVRNLGDAGRYVWIRGRHRATEWGYSLCEVAVFGRPARADNQRPTASISSPVEGTHYLGPVDIDLVAEARDPDGHVDRVVFSLDGSPVATAFTAPFTTRVTLVTGNHTIGAYAVDNEGLRSAAVSVGVSVESGQPDGNLALGRPAWSSSFESTELLANRAVDGNGATRWSSAFSDPQWIYVDLGDRYFINTVVLKWETAYAAAFDLQVSDDAVQWTTARSASGTPGVQTLTAVGGIGRYVRVLGTSRATPWGYSLWEIEVYGEPAAVPGANVAQGRPTVASSTENASYGAARATDGSGATRWSSQFADGQWIYVDLGGLYDITRVVLRWETAFGSDYSIDVSNDLSAWRSIRQVIGGDGGVDDLDRLASTARYVRMSGTHRGTPWGFSLWEFEVYGAPPTPGPNLAVHGDATASSTEAGNGNLAPLNAIDNSGSTRWSSEFADNQWIRVDLGAETDIKRLVLRWETAYAKTYAIQLSDDPAAGWQTVLTNAAGDGGVDDLTIDGRARFVQVLCATRATPWGFSLWEIEVYGTPTVNLLDNGGFETADPLVPGQPAGWSREMWTATSQFASDAAIVHSGSTSVRIASPVENDASWTHPVTLEPNVNYVLSGWIRTENVAAGAGATLGLMGTWQHTTGQTGTRDWTNVRMMFNSGASGSVVIAARLGYWGATSSGTAWFDDISVTPFRPGATPNWKILVLIYAGTDFTYVKDGVEHHVVGAIAPAQVAAAAANATRFVEQDIPALDSGQMVPQVTIRYPGTLTRFSHLCTREDGEYGFWPSPGDTAPDLDPAFDSVIVITQPNVVDQNTGRLEWAGCAAGLTPGMGTGQLYTTLIADAATSYGHRNVFKHEWGHSITSFFDAMGIAPKPMVENHAVAGQYVHCGTGAAYVWADETDANPIPNSIYSNESGFTHDYYSGTTALASSPAQCLGVTSAAWAAGGPVSVPY